MSRRTRTSLVSSLFFFASGRSDRGLGAELCCISTMFDGDSLHNLMRAWSGTTGLYSNGGSCLGPCLTGGTTVVFGCCGAFFFECFTDDLSLCLVGASI